MDIETNVNSIIRGENSDSRISNANSRARACAFAHLLKTNNAKIEINSRITMKRTCCA